VSVFDAASSKYVTVKKAIEIACQRGADRERARIVALLGAEIDSRVLEPEATDALEDMLRQIEASEA